MHSSLQYMYLLSSVWLSISKFAATPALIHYAHSTPGERLGSGLIDSCTCSIAYQATLWLRQLFSDCGGRDLSVWSIYSCPVKSTFIVNMSNF